MSTLLVRLYSEEEFKAMNEFTEPEIVRISLDDIALQVYCSFSFLSIATAIK